MASFDSASLRLETSAALDGGAVTGDRRSFG
jgi:hypothetical protein